jgi:putative transposase
MKYSFIAQNKKTWPIDPMCRLLEVERNNYYSYQKRNANKVEDRVHGDMLEKVKEIAKATDNTYGARRIKRKLNSMSFPVGRVKTKQLMKEAGVWVRYKKKYKVTTNSDHKLPVFDNKLKQKFDVEQPNQVYVSDITYIWTQEGWLYLATVIDLFSRKVVGWSMGSRMKAQLVCDALTMAIWQRNPGRGLIVHTDQGSQYASKSYRRLLSTNGFEGSMSRRGNCWDNGVPRRQMGEVLPICHAA